MRIRGLEEGEAPWVARPLYWIVKRMYGRVMGPLKVQARTPWIFWLVNLTGAAVEKSGFVERRIHCLVHLRAAQRIGCPF